MSNNISFYIVDITSDPSYKILIKLFYQIRINIELHQNRMIEFIKCNTSNETIVNEALDIYINSFPSNERHPLDVIRERIKMQKSILYAGVEDNKVNCFALIWNLKESDFILLDYFAVEEKHRNKGIGTMFYNFLLKEISKIERFLILEVEKPKDKFDISKINRIKFYLRNKTQILNDTPYILPALDSTTNTEMILMIAEGQKCRELTNEKIKNLIEQIYFELYQRDIKDLLLLSFIQKIPKYITLTKQIKYD
jgi:hypothetical protein